MPNSNPKISHLNNQRKNLTGSITREKAILMEIAELKGYQYGPYFLVDYYIGPFGKSPEIVELAKKYLSRRRRELSVSERIRIIKMWNSTST